MDNHSSLPWKIGAKAPTLILTAYDEGVAVATPHGRKTPLRIEITLANAAYIVQACNAFPDLVKALEDTISASERAIGDHIAPEHCYATGPKTGDALADLVECPACIAAKVNQEARAILAKAKAGA